MLLRRPSAADVSSSSSIVQPARPPCLATSPLLAQQDPRTTTTAATATAHRQCSSQDTTERGGSGHAHHASTGQSPLQGCAVSRAGTASARRTARHSLGTVGRGADALAHAPLISDDGSTGVAAAAAGAAAGGVTSGAAGATTTTHTPTLAQVLASAFLRQAFEDTVLLDRLAASAPPADLHLWTRLDSFFWRHYACSDSELYRRRADLAATAAAILDDHAERAAALLAAAHSTDTVPALRAYLATPGALVTAAFFRPLEVALCAPHFAHFGAQLHVHVRP